MFADNQGRRNNLEHAESIRSRYAAASYRVQEMANLNQNIDGHLPAGAGYEGNSRRMQNIIGKACISFFSDGGTTSLASVEEQVLSGKAKDLAGLVMKQLLADSSFSDLNIETHRFEYTCHLMAPPEKPEPQSYYLWKDANQEYRLLIVHPNPASEGFAHLPVERKPQRAENESFNLTEREHVKKALYLNLLNKQFVGSTGLAVELSLWFASLSRYNKTDIKYKDIFWSCLEDRSGLSARFCSYLSYEIGKPQVTRKTRNDDEKERPALVWPKTYGAAAATHFGNFFSLFQGNWGEGSMYYRSNPSIRPDKEERTDTRDDVGAIIGAIAHKFTNENIEKIEDVVKNLCTHGIRR